MRSLNSVLLLFLSLVIISVSVLWQVLSSRQFSTFISKQITQHFSSRHQAEVSFSKMDLSLFPPGIELSKVNLYHKNWNLNLEALRVEFNPFIGRFQNFDLSKVHLMGGVFLQKEQETGAPAQEFKGVEAVTQQIIAQLQGLPIHELIISDVSIDMNKKGSLFVYQFSSKNQINSLDCTFKIRNNLQLNIPYLGEINGLKGGAQVFADHIEMQGLSVFSRESSLQMDGMIFGKGTSLRDVGADLKLQVLLNLRQLSTFGEDISGIAVSTVKLEKKAGDLFPSLRGEISVEDLSYNKEYIPSLHSRFFTKDGSFWSDLALRLGKNGKVQMPSVALYDFSKNDFMTEGEYRFSISDVNFRELRGNIGKKLSILEGSVNGDFVLAKNKKHWKISSEQGFDISDFVFRASSRGDAIIQNPKVSLNQISIEPKDKSILIGSWLKAGENVFNVQGVIGESGFSIKADKSLVNLEELGPIVGLDIKGRGVLDLLVEQQAGKDLELGLRGELKEASFNKYFLGIGKIDFNYNISQNLIRIKKYQGLVGAGAITFHGDVNLQKKTTLDLVVSMARADYRDIMLVAAPVFQGANVPDNIWGSWGADVHIYGPVSKEDLVIKGGVSGKNILLGDEFISSIHSDFHFKDGHLNVEKFLLSKNQGKIRGNALLNLNTNPLDVSYVFDLDKFDLADFTYLRRLIPNVSGVIRGSIKGAGLINNLSSDVEFFLEQTKVGHRRVEPSKISLRLDEKVISFSSTLMNKIFVASGIIDLRAKKNSFVEYHGKVKDWNLLLASLFGEHVWQYGKMGEASFDGSWKFNIQDLSHSDVIFNLYQLSFRKKGKELSLQGKENGIAINNGVIEKWKISLGGELGRFSSEASGRLAKQLSISALGNIQADFLEFLNPKIGSIGGQLGGRFVLEEEHGEYDYLLQLEGRKVDVFYTGLPDEFTDLNFRLLVKDENLIVENLNGVWGQGKFSSQGRVKLALVPEVNLSLQLDEMLYKIADNSSVSFSGEVLLSGNAPPYLLKTNLSLQGASINDEPEAFIKQKQSQLKLKYVPIKKKQDILSQLLNLDGRIVVARPLEVRNRMMNMGIMGDMSVIGSVDSPSLKGKLSAISGDSRLYFKGNEFVVSKSDLFFNGGSELNPTIDLLASTTIADYKILLKVFGPSDRFKLELQSDPVLPSNEIVSLLVLGYTSEISKGLQDRDRENLTSAGVGSLLLEQFGLNKTLDEFFGLKLKLAPEFDQSEDSFLEGRSVGGNGSSSGIRSVTKVEVRKKINTKMDMTISSSLGGDEQKQKMNLNYQLKDNVIATGIYEMKTGSETTDDNTGRSLGVDIKFRRTFE